LTGVYHELVQAARNIVLNGVIRQWD